MSAAAHNLYDILYFQIVERGISQFEEMDTDDDGLLSIQEVHVLPPIIANQLIENSTGEWLWFPGIDPDEDGYISLSEERLPLWNQTFEYLTTAEYPGSKWFQSHFSLSKNIDIIGNVSASVLILQGEEDTQTPVSEAFLLEQRLTDVGHSDHTLITYPRLGHTFYPKEGFLQWLGPIQDHVLSDLANWLKDPERDLHILDAQLQTAMNTEKALQNQLDDLSSELEYQTRELDNQIEELKSESANLRKTITELETHNDELQSALNQSRNLNYFTLGIAIITVLLIIVQTYRRRTA